MCALVYTHTHTHTHIETHTWLIVMEIEKIEKSQIRQTPSRDIFSIKIWSYPVQLPQKLVLPEGRILFSLTFNLNLNPHVN